MDANFQMGDMALGQANAAKAMAAPSAGSAQIGKAASDFQGMFMSQMLKPMFDSVQVDPIFGGGHGEEVMRSFLVQEYGKLMAGGGKFGLDAAVRNELISAQAKAHGKSTQTQGGASNAVEQIQ